MTGLVVHQCPKCELRFSFRTELDYHLREDHPASWSPARLAGMLLAVAVVLVVAYAAVFVSIAAAAVVAAVLVTLGVIYLRRRRGQPRVPRR